MTYRDSLRYLDSFLNLERIVSLDAARMNLKRMRILLNWFGHPEKNYFPFLIAGTKGKGSTGFFIESILRKSRITCGFYSSPHLVDPRERIRINGRMVSEKLWCRGIQAIRKELTGRKLPGKAGAFTYFEMTTLLAALIFKYEKVKVGIFEVGMGGRLDATNAIPHSLSVLTPVHMDHEAILGNTIAKIASEKAAIISRKADVVCSPQKNEAMRVIQKEAKRQKAKVYLAKPVCFETGLKGDYQRLNAGTAVLTCRVLKEKHGFVIPEKAIAQGLHEHGWPGRFELIKGRPSFLLDGAHNPASAAALTSALERYYPHARRLLIFGAMRDKKSEPMLAALGKYFDAAILTKASSTRSQDIDVLLKEARPHFKHLFPAGNVRESLDLAKRIGGPDALIVLTGSFYLIGEGRKILKTQ